jgi:hypothetical protein
VSIFVACEVACEEKKNEQGTEAERGPRLEKPVVGKGRPGMEEKLVDAHSRAQPKPRS